MNNRIYKFRAWDKKKNKWLGIKGASIAFPYARALPELGFPWVDGLALFGFGKETNNVVWMQWTGLVDRNSKEIYEGDIITIDGQYEQPRNDVLDDVLDEPLTEEELKKNPLKHYLVEYDENHTAFIPICNWGLYSQEVEVIGNVWENPELLKGTK